MQTKHTKFVHCDHFNNAFMDAFSDDVDQSIDEHMTKFKGCSSMRQYLQSEPVKWILNDGLDLPVVRVVYMNLTITLAKRKMWK